MIPWDLDATMLLEKTEWYKVTYDTDIYYQFLESNWQSNNPFEREERPLVRRMMKYAEYRNAFIDRYKEAMNTIFKKEEVFRELDSLALRIQQNSSNGEFQRFNNSVNSCKLYLQRRWNYISSVLDTISYLDTVPVTGYIDPYPEIVYLDEETIGPGLGLGDPYPNPAGSDCYIDLRIDKAQHISMIICDINGRETGNVMDAFMEQGSHTLLIRTHELNPGIYFIRLNTRGQSICRRLVVM